MVYKNIEFHNVDGMNTMWNGHSQLQRVPEELRLKLNPGAQEQSRVAANAEIRFVSDGPVQLTLNSDKSAEFHVSHGSFYNAGGFPVTGGALTYVIDMPENLKALKPEYTDSFLFHPRVTRVLLPKTVINFVNIEGENLRVPVAGEVPEKRVLFYGTSITQGGCASMPHLSYAAQTATRLGADLINLGMSGSCHAEPEFADYIAERKDWDLAVLSLSVNMVGCFTVDEFRKRVEYTVNTVGAKNPDKPVACITLFPHFRDLSSNQAKEEQEKSEAFRRVLRETAAAYSGDNVTLIEGPEILDRIDGLTADMIHPSDAGMLRMGENLAGRLKGLV